ncbi:MAG: carboxymuconolactone decarboxylase family protein [Microbacteriaceae bacterium]|nr:carboxymuconolactone decarboxylase family protein [Microbacteriaceae bacterium]
MSGASDEERRAEGMAIRREVLGDEHVDRANAGVTDVDRDFQDFITRVAWGDIWSRPGLARRDRSIAVITALIAADNFPELPMHFRAAIRNGLALEEIQEVVLQAAVYVGVPKANHAFKLLKETLGA